MANNRGAKENWNAVGTHDRRVVYCYVRVRTETPVRTLPDLITGEVLNTVWLGEEYKRFDSTIERDTFISDFDAATYKPKQLKKRSMHYGEDNECCDIEKITGDTVATGVIDIVRRKQVNTRMIVK